VLTDRIWEKTPESIKQDLTIVSKTHGWNYADSGRVMDVYVLKKRDRAGLEP
jgi:hypothetical protein